MNQRTFKRPVACMIGILITFMWVVTTQAQSQAKGASGLDELDQQFHKARESFLKKDFKEAAAEIRKEGTVVKQEGENAVGEARQALIDSAEELDKLADRVEAKSVQSVQEVDETFSRVHHALAKYYRLKASESWAQRAISVAGYDLKAAAVHLENALTWAGHGLEKGSESVINEAKQVGEKLQKGTTWAASEVDKGIDDIGKEIDETGHKIAFLGSFKTSIRVSEEGGGPIDLTTAIIQVAKQNLPTVVYIEVTESREVQNPLLPFEKDPFFRRFFGIPKMPRKFRQEIKGLGSGMIIDSEGHILTNYHVAGNATKLEVTLADRNKYSGRMVGGDPKTDLAVIQISAKENLPVVTFGDSDRVEVGDWVVAIGAPQALEKSVTQGIISAKHRTGITDPNSYQDFLQTDAAINPGNSGGPLLNMYGQVIGVNAAIATESGGFEGIGFTIPSNMAVYVANALIAHGKVERGWLGITIGNLTPDLSKKLHLQTLKGALIEEVVKGGPAEMAGFKKNDVVIAFGGKDISDSSTLRNDVAETLPGQEEKVTILRDGKREELTVKIGNLEEATKILKSSVKQRLGVEVRTPTPKEVERYGLNQNQGVVITWLDSKSPFKEAGFEVGDMILAINGRPVEGVKSFADIVSSLKQKEKVSVLALDHRTGNTGNVFVLIG